MDINVWRHLEVFLLSCFLPYPLLILFFNVNTALDSCLQYGREKTYYWFSFMHVKLNIFELYFYTHKILMFKCAS